MQDRQAEALRGLSDTVAYGQGRDTDLGREPIPYTLTPLAEALLSAADPEAVTR